MVLASLFAMAMSHACPYDPAVSARVVNAYACVRRCAGVCCSSELK